MGLPTAIYISNKGLAVRGYDTNEEAVANAKSLGIVSTAIWNDVPSADVYVVCVSSLLKGNAPRMFLV